MVQKDDCKDDFVNLTFCYTFPNGVTLTEDHKFKKCTNLKELKLRALRYVAEKVEKSSAHNPLNFNYCTELILTRNKNINITLTESEFHKTKFDKTLEDIVGTSNFPTRLEVKTYFRDATEISEFESQENASDCQDFKITTEDPNTLVLKLKKFSIPVKSCSTKKYVPGVYEKDYVDYDEATEFNKKSLFNNTEIAKPNYVGLVNQAMTCYLNSLLQALYMTPEFRNALYNWEYKSSDKDSEDVSIPYQLQKLFLNLQTSSKRAVETTSLTRSFGWDIGEAWQQHDIQELCRVMFDALEQKFKNTAQADLINRLYEGKINDYVKCLTCNTEKSREDTFLDIPLPVKPYGTTVAYGSVEEALDAFVKYETLEGNNQYFCEKCNKKSNAHKGLKFTKFPYILTLQLKRFDFDQSSYHRIKLNDKVTFPDVLNLNPFIESISNQESPNGEEDVGLSIKCNDSSTTDSSTMDEDYASSDTALISSNHLINNDQDDDRDEGIDMSNGIDTRYGMTSSRRTCNHDIQQIRNEYASSKGPYIYDLFSIMIHSGSANGGHYYVYIKDFGTDKWLCFNDQIVQPITHEEIQKTYGGGSSGGYYGVYRSSTNAYMLMYRQIDPERNVLPMKAEDFPPHIKDLLEKMKVEKKLEEERMDRHYRDESAISEGQKEKIKMKEKKKMEEERMDRHYRDESEISERRMEKIIYFRHPLKGTVDHVTVSINTNNTLAEITALAYKEANIDEIVDLDQCRIVSYYKKYDLIYCTYDDQEDQTFDVIFQSKCPKNFDEYFTSTKDLLLDIRDKKEEFEVYPSPAIVSKVFVIDALAKDLVDGPKYIPVFEKQTVKEYKQVLKKHFNLDPNEVQLLCLNILPDELLHDDFVFTFNNKRDVYKISATESYDEGMLENLRESVFYSMSEFLDDIVTFYLDLRGVTKEEKERLNIPTLTNYRKEKEMKNKEPKRKEDLMRMVEEVGTLSKNGKIVQISDREEWNIQESSNSEDSSLSDSDRTLVGDPPEENEESEQFEEPQFEEYKTTVPFKYRNIEHYPHLRKKYFRITEVRRSKILKVSMDENILLAELKEKLEVYLEIPKKYFRITENSVIESDSLCLSEPSTFEEDATYFIVLGRILSTDETNVDIYILEMNCSEPMRKLFTIILKKNATFGDMKHQILMELKQNSILDLPYERCRFFGSSYTSLIPLDNYPDKDMLNCVFPNCSIEAICIQKLQDGTQLSEDSQSLIYIRRWNRLEDPQEIIVDHENFIEQLKEKVPKLSNIPSECLEFCPLPCMETVIYMKSVKNKNIENLEWKSDIKLDAIDSTTYLMYRDSRELSENQESMAPISSCRFDESGISERRGQGIKRTGYRTSLVRKERALKINVNST